MRYYLFSREPERAPGTVPREECVTIEDDETVWVGYRRDARGPGESFALLRVEGDHLRDVGMGRAPVWVQEAAIELLQVGHYVRVEQPGGGEAR